jgi:hypothetical protein
VWHGERLVVNRFAALPCGMGGGSWHGCNPVAGVAVPSIRPGGPAGTAPVSLDVQIARSSAENPFRGITADLIPAPLEHIADHVGMIKVSSQAMALSNSHFDLNGAWP